MPTFAERVAALCIARDHRSTGADAGGRVSLLARLTAAVAAIPPEAPPDRDAVAFRAEADRRRRLALSLRDPRLYDVRQRLRLELDAFHDAYLGVWLFPDRDALEAARTMISAGTPSPPAPTPMRELRTRLAVRVGGVYTTPPHRVAEGWPPRVRVERVRDVTLPDGAKLYVAAVVPFTAAPPAG